MSIKYDCRTKAKASLKLYNQISSFLFEQEFGELNNNPKAKLALQEAKRHLLDIVKTEKS